jgi:hypothetical protein
MQQNTVIVGMLCSGKRVNKRKSKSANLPDISLLGLLLGEGVLPLGGAPPPQVDPGRALHQRRNPAHTAKPV